jgi:hypothetical protein
MIGKFFVVSSSARNANTTRLRDYDYPSRRALERDVRVDAALVSRS